MAVNSSHYNKFDEFDYNANFDNMMSQVVTAIVLSTDTESTGLKVKDARSKCIGISVAGRDPLQGNRVFSHYFPVAHTKRNLSPENKKCLLDHIGSRGRSNPLVFHNAKFDLFSLATAGLDFNGFFYDTVLMVKLLNENYVNYKLDWLGKYILKNEGKRKSPVWESLLELYGWERADHFPPEVMGDYATGDTELTLELFEWAYPQFKKEGFDG